MENKECLFFTYGTLKENYHNHYILGDAKPLGEFTTEPKYSLFDGGFPVVERDGNTAIKGELFLSKNPNNIQSVFNLEGCSSQKQNDPRNWYDYDLIDTPHGKAVIFVMDKGKSGRSKELKNGIWK